MRKRILLLALILIVGIVPTSAQDQSNPLLDLLARVPDAPAAHEYLSYADYQAIFASYPGATRPTSYQSFADLTANNGSADGRAVMGALMSITSGPQLFQNVLRGDAVATTMGFDLFSVDRGVEYGNPPASVTLIEGDFDADTVIAAHEARGFIVSETNGLPLLCGAAGCDAGMDVNLKDVNPANIFGGKFGRSQPTLVGDNLIASSASIDAINLTASAISGDSDSLADQPDFRAAAEAITANGTLTQAYLITPETIPQSVMDTVLFPSLTAKQRQDMIAQIEASFVPMPPYTLVAIADAVNDGVESAMVALVYADPADADAAATLFPERLTTYQSYQTKQTLGDMFADRQVTSVDASVFTPSVDRAVMVLTITTPLVSPDQTDGPRTPISDPIFRLLTNAYFARDLGWLATTP